MAYNQDAYGGDIRQGYDCGLTISGNPESMKKTRGVYVRNAEWRELAAVEIPLLMILFLIVSVSLLFTPTLEFEPLGFELPVITVCPLFALTGLPCLMCGMTRSFLAMGSFDPLKALIYHPLGPALFIAAVVLFISLTLSVVLKKQIRLSLVSASKRKLIYLSTAVFLIAWPVKVVIWHQVGLL